jgi:hypothetical protein
VSFSEFEGEISGYACSTEYLSSSLWWFTGVIIFAISYPEKIAPERLYLFAIVFRSNAAADHTQSYEQVLAEGTLAFSLRCFLLSAPSVWPADLSFRPSAIVE